jgi:hypothetical protein
LKTTKTLTGACEHCSGPIEFDANTIGHSVLCPYCRKQTEFHLPAFPEEPAIPKGLVRWTVVAMIILLAGLAAAIFGLKLMEKKLAEHQREKQGIATPATP